jgi:YHS domain-containing protein
MAARWSRRSSGVALAMVLLAVAGSLPVRAAKSEETVTCAVCGKRVKKSQAIKVIQDGRVFYVCSEACLAKLKQKKKK